ncbi:MAG: enoyl-CoA hydratase/isomerase family protein [Deltaproteobacteria bacterium]|nr:enoyl-CoA hydratase/isomerase family protein [Deltaproteobacteria bacterium]MBW2299010.1 enoyl-CoA hydratase/isomerase family protein [Deltaproteobacteria bacterium]
MKKGNVFRVEKEDSVRVITFDVPGKNMNTWTQEAIDGFYDLLSELESDLDARGVIFISGKPGNFHAGADLNLLTRMKERSEAEKALAVFHTAFKRLSSLPCPTLAAIDGHCLGGGLEFALACSARIARESEKTLLGLPECTLGIFPGSGGTQRLPRLIGLKAVELILKGEVLPAAKAYELGMIDRLVPEEGDLLREAKRFLEEIISGREKLLRKDHDFSQIDQVAEMARKEILKTTRGREIPGPMLALKSMQEGLKGSLEQGLEVEKNNFIEVILSNQAKGSIHTFFLKTMSDKPANMMSKGFEPKPINKVCILGFGTMGRGIAIDILRRTQARVIAKDVPQALEKGKEFVNQILDGLAEKGKLKEPREEIVKHLDLTSEYTDDFSDADLVLEAVIEDAKVKAKVYEDLSNVVRDDCILATNTSSIPLGTLAKHVKGTERFAGLHFFSPVWLMQLVEIVKGEATASNTVDNLLHFSSLIRKRPIICKDNPGFVVNAVLFPYFMDALHFLEKGNPIEKVDEAFTQFGMPVGPIKLIDEVGIDISYQVIAGRGLEQDTLKNVVRAGRFGLKKSGKGFYLKDGRVDPEVLPLIAVKQKREMSAVEMQIKVLEDMVRVGKDLLDRGVVEDPRMIDIGLIWGAGFPPDRGGPMKWADLVGLSRKLFGKTFYPDE